MLEVVVVMEFECTSRLLVFFVLSLSRYMMMHHPSSSGNVDLVLMLHGRDELRAERVVNTYSGRVDLLGVPQHQLTCLIKKERERTWLELRCRNSSSLHQHCCLHGLATITVSPRPRIRLILILTLLQPTLGGASGHGYQPPGACAADALYYPTWLKGVNLGRRSSFGATATATLIQAVIKRLI